METWPDFVRESEASTPRAENDLTGWETVVFELEDVSGAAGFSPPISSAG